MSQEPAMHGPCHQHVDLDRHFHEFSQKELADPDLLAAYNEEHAWTGSLSWKDVLERKRVVVLASAGSGKTHEMRVQQIRLLADGKFAFHVPLEALANEAFVDLLPPDDARRFEEWRAAPQAPAWFFLDAVDELKLMQRKLEHAFRRLRQAIDGNLNRARVIVSSRPTDWRPVTDEASFRRWLPEPAVVQECKIPAEEVFLKALSRNEPRRSNEAQPAKDPKGELVTTVLLLPLADRHIRQFAQQRGVSDCNELFNEIGRSNAWLFARRPLDLDDLIALWNAKGQLGCREEQHAFNVSSKLKDSPDRPDAGVLSDQEAIEGAEHVALAMALTRTRTLKVPDQTTVADPAEATLDPAVLFRAWTPEQRAALLRRALFDPATFGRVRFHHRSVQEYLAARRLSAFRKKGMSVRATFRLLFADKYGERVVIPSMRPIAAWLALWDEDVRRELVSREPDVLIEYGDPASLNFAVRGEIIRAFVCRHGAGGWRGFRFPMDQLERIACPELADVIAECWGDGPENPEVRELLLELIWKGRVSQCVSIANKVAISSVETVEHRTIAIRALVSCSADTQIKTIAGRMLSKPDQWPSNLISSVLPELFPAFLNISELIALLERHEARRLEGSINAFEWSLHAIVTNQTCVFDRRELRRRMTDLVQGSAEPGSNSYNVSGRHGDLCSVIAILCSHELDASASCLDPCLLRSCAVAYHMCGREHRDGQFEVLRTRLAAEVGTRAEIFWMELSLMDSIAPTDDSWHRFWVVWTHSLIGDLVASDRHWIEAALRDPSDRKRQEVAVHGWIRIWAVEGAKRRRLPQMRAALGGDARLVTIFDGRMQKSKDTAEMRRYERESKRRQAELAAREEKRLSDWKAWREDLMRSPEDHFTDQRRQSTIYSLFHCMEGRRDSRNSYGVWNRPSLVEMFGEMVAAQAMSAFKAQWRTTKPELWSERQEAERGSKPYVWIFGLCGIMAEAETSEWAKKLASDEARLATRYATVELNGFAPFITDLAKARPAEVDEVLGTELDAELVFGGSHSYLPVLQDLTHADISLKSLLKPRLLAFIARRSSLEDSADVSHWGHNLNQILGILRETATDSEARSIGSACIAQLKKTPAGPLAITWLRGVFRFAPEQGVDLFIECFYSQDGAKADDRSLKAFAALFGAWEGVGVRIADHDQRVAALGKLLRIAYRIVRPEDDVEHEGCYTPDARDEAERGRSFLLSALLETPGHKAQQLLMQLSHEPEFRRFPDRLRHLARERAAKDAEFGAWSADAIERLNEGLEMPPNDRDGLFRVMMDRLDDFQHNVLHDDFMDRRTLQGIHNEPEMQRAIAQKLKAAAREAYTVTREEEVADGKKPDIRLLAPAGGTKAAIEVKIADDRWSVLELEKALEVQLVGKYLRHENCRAGCLLLTDNGTRKSWQTSRKSKRLGFDELIAQLNEKAGEIEAAHGYEVKVAVFGLNLAGV